MIRRIFETLFEAFMEAIPGNNENPAPAKETKPNPATAAAAAAIITADAASIVAADGNRPHILLGICGSAAAAQTPHLLASLQGIGAVQVVTTDKSYRFWKRDGIDPTLIWTDDREGAVVQGRRADKTPRIHLSDWSDILVIAPMTDNTMNKLANGLADNLLTSTYSAWHEGRPVIAVPSMEVRIWRKMLTRQNLTEMICRPGHTVVYPDSGAMKGGDGLEKMAGIKTIVDAVKTALVDWCRTASPND